MQIWNTTVFGVAAMMRGSEEPEWVPTGPNNS